MKLLIILQQYLFTNGLYTELLNIAIYVHWQIQLTVGTKMWKNIPLVCHLFFLDAQMHLRGACIALYRVGGLDLRVPESLWCLPPPR